MSANASNTSDTLITWSFSPISELILMPFSLLLNGLVIIAFLLNSHLRTPFNVYLVNLVITNFIYTLIEIPWDIANGIYSTWWMGAPICDLYQYVYYVFMAVIINTHMLITSNRIWALTFPHSYAHRHTVRTAAMCCLAVWVYVHAACLPGFFINAWNRLPLETSGCTLNYEVLSEWNIFTEFGLFVLPEALIIAAYPFLLCKRRKQRLPRLGRRNQIQLQPVSGTTNNTSQGGALGVEKRTGRRHRENKRAFGILTASTLSATLTWTPGSAYYGISCFMDVSHLSTFLLVAAFLFLVQMVIDPILFMFVLSDLRIAAWQIVRNVRLPLLR